MDTSSVQDSGGDRLQAGARANPLNRLQMRWALTSLVSSYALMMWSVWDRGDAVIALLALLVIRFVCSHVLFKLGVRLDRRAVCMGSVMALNLFFCLVEAIILQWSLLAWFHLLFQVLFLNGFEERDDYPRHRWGVAVFLPVVVVLGLRAGVEHTSIGLFCYAAVILYGLGETRSRMLVDALADAREGHQRLQRMQAQLVAQEKLSSLGLLATGVAHEINNPMAFVTSNIRTLAKDLASLPQEPELLREYAEEVLPETLEGIRRVNAIVADLRRFAREEPEQPTEFDLNAEISSALRLSQSELRQRCKVELELGGLPPLVGRPQQIGQVVMSLLVNAAKAMPPEGGVVKVSTRAGPGEVLVQVRDTGVGMSKEVLGQLFQPFFTTRVGEGRGLGLAVAHGIITGHGGRIEVESEPGKGSCFTLRLPSPTVAAQGA